MTGHNCFVDTQTAVTEFVAANVTAAPLAATAINWFFLCAAFYGLFKFTVCLINHVRGVLGMVMPAANVRKMGEWAVVTGATDGIGKAYAFELARKVSRGVGAAAVVVIVGARGVRPWCAWRCGTVVCVLPCGCTCSRGVSCQAKMQRPHGVHDAAILLAQGLNVVLISRTQSKLDAVKAELEDKYPKVEVTVVAVDYSKFDAAAQARVKKVVDNLDVGVLVNNVGMSYPRPYDFLEAPLELTDRLVEVNINSMTRMTYLVLPGMKSRRRGCIINVSSGAGSLPQPLQATYVSHWKLGVCGAVCPCVTVRGVCTQCAACGHGGVALTCVFVYLPRCAPPPVAAMACTGTVVSRTSSTASASLWTWSAAARASACLPRRPCSWSATCRRSAARRSSCPRPPRTPVPVWRASATARRGSCRTGRTASSSACTTSPRAGSCRRVPSTCT